MRQVGVLVKPLRVGFSWPSPQDEKQSDPLHSLRMTDCGCERPTMADTRVCPYTDGISSTPTRSSAVVTGGKQAKFWQR